ncbi:uncharacterized protein LOC144621293 [Crassostrea virginica]
MASAMDPLCQDVIRCTLCESAVVPMYCEVCHIDLCKDCVEKHLADKSKLHNVVSLKQYLSTSRNPKCSEHPDTTCELYCENCECPICVHCVSSKKHKHHDYINFKKFLQKKQEVVRRDLRELEQRIYPDFQKAISVIPIQKAEQRKHSKKLITAVKMHGKALHTEIDIIVKRMETEINDIEAQHQTALDKQENAINHTIRQITQTIQDLKNLLETRDVSLVSGYKSRIRKFRKLPPNLNVIPTNFNPVKINNEQLLKQFGTLSPIPEVRKHSMQRNESSSQARPFLDVSRLITNIKTEFKFGLYNVSCLSDEAIWTSGFSSCMMLYNLNGELLRYVETKSGNLPGHIVVTRSKDLLYTDNEDESINLVSDLSENRNSDICVADKGARAVTVVTAAGRLRFRYFGPSSTSRESFEPTCITTDSQANILISDKKNIQIIDQDGYFLRYIDNSGLLYPQSLCVDSRDNLFVAYFNTSEVKKIQYYK